MPTDAKSAEISKTSTKASNNHLEQLQKYGNFVNKTFVRQKKKNHKNLLPHPRTQEKTIHGKGKKILVSLVRETKFYLYLPRVLDRT